MRALDHRLPGQGRSQGGGGAERVCASLGFSGTRGSMARESQVEPFSGVEIHMEMDMEWKWGTICENRMDWIGFGAECRLKTI